MLEAIAAIERQLHRGKVACKRDEVVQGSSGATLPEEERGR
jgi:hypothetical protein